MPTTILDPMPPEVEALIRRRRELGQDLHDEVWKGNYHLVPGPHPRHGDVQRQLLVVLDEPTRQAGLLLAGDRLRPGRLYRDRNCAGPSRRVQPAGVELDPAAVDSAYQRAHVLQRAVGIDRGSEPCHQGMDQGAAAALRRSQPVEPALGGRNRRHLPTIGGDQQRARGLYMRGGGLLRPPRRSATVAIGAARVGRLSR